jgi:hypothetical protein
MQTFTGVRIMKSKTVGIAATTGLFGVAMGAFLAPPSTLLAQQKNDYEAPTATPTDATPAQGAPQKPQNGTENRCPKSGGSYTLFATARGTNGAPRFREASFDGPPRGGFDGPPGGEGEGRRGPDGFGGPGGRDGRPPGPPPAAEGEDGHAHGPQLSDMLARLNLSEAQNEKLGKVLSFEREKMEALHQQQVKIQSQTRTSLEAILTTEQKQQLEKMETQMSGPDDGPPGGRPRGPRGPRPDGRRGGPRGGEDRP